MKPSRLLGGTCPVCQREIHLIDVGEDGQLVGSCGDSFARPGWEAENPAAGNGRSDEDKE